MKLGRQSKIIELIRKNEIETQDELTERLVAEGFRVTQATVSRDIRELKITKIPMSNGKQKYAVLAEAGEIVAEKMSGKYERVLKEGLLSMNKAQNILVIKTVSGMASAVCAAIDAMDLTEVVGSIAGDDTIMCVVHTVEDTESLMKKIRRIIEG